MTDEQTTRPGEDPARPNEYPADPAQGDPGVEMGSGGTGAGGVPPAAGSVGVGADAGARAPDNIRITMLVSAILNCLAALGWAAGCVTAPIGIPLVVLAVYEFITYGKLGEPGYRRYVGRTKTLHILEICSILLGNLGSLVCGILGMVFAGQEREKGRF